MKATKILTIIMIILGLVCLGTILAVSYPSIDSHVCMSRVAKVINSSPDFDSVRERIIRMLQPGMTREQVRATLEKIGPVQISKYGSENTDRILIKACSFSMNNLPFLLTYTPDGRLVEAEYEYLDN